MARQFKTTIKDKGYKKAMESFKEIKRKPYVKIGVMESAGAHKEAEGLSVVDVATFHEYGTEGVPERSFMRSTVDQNFESYVEKSIQLQGKVVLQQLSVESALAILGEQIQSDIVNTINSGIPPELAESTLRAKTVNGKVGDTPLVDSGQLKQSIRYKVEA
jgi:hypothetical protein